MGGGAAGETAPAGHVTATVVTVTGAGGTATAMMVAGTATATTVMTVAGTATVMVGVEVLHGNELVGAVVALAAATMTRPRGGLRAEAVAAPLLGAMGTTSRHGAGLQAAATAVLTAPRLTGWWTWASPPPLLSVRWRCRAVAWLTQRIGPLRRRRPRPLRARRVRPQGEGEGLRPRRRLQSLTYCPLMTQQGGVRFRRLQRLVGVPLQLLRRLRPRGRVVTPAAGCLTFLAGPRRWLRRAHPQQQVQVTPPLAHRPLLPCPRRPPQTLTLPTSPPGTRPRPPPAHPWQSGWQQPPPRGRRQWARVPRSAPASLPSTSSRLRLRRRPDLDRVRRREGRHQGVRRGWATPVGLTRAG